MIERVQVLIGGNDNEWVIRFSREVYRECGVSPFNVPSIDVSVESGVLELMPGYRGGSMEASGEAALFAGVRPEIEAAVAVRTGRLDSVAA